jgi:hypothetical protein
VSNNPNIFIREPNPGELSDMDNAQIAAAKLRVLAADLRNMPPPNHPAMPDLSPLISEIEAGSRELESVPDLICAAIEEEAMDVI